MSNKKAFEKVRRAIMEKDSDQGGIKMMNLHFMQNSFYLQWAGTIHDNMNQNLAEIPLWEYARLARELNAFSMNIRENHLILDKIKNPFWKKSINNSFEIQEQPL